MPGTTGKTPHDHIASGNAVSVAKPKAELSALIHRVEKKYDSVTILRRRIPVAKIIPFPSTPRQLLGRSMLGTGHELGGIVSPLDITWSVHEQ